jgi:Ca-activated chloride channel family protein
MIRNRASSVTLIGLVLLALSCLSFAQDRPRVFNVDVDIVQVPVTITDSRGAYISGLEREHFEIFEDKISQEISYFSTEDTAMSLGIVLDISKSMDPVLASARRNGGACLDIGTRQDEYFLLTFADKLLTNTDFTTDIRDLRAELMTLKAKGNTALYDAVYAGVAKLKDATNPRKALVVVTDGFENHSRYSRTNLREAVKESDIQIYTIGNRGDGALRELSEITGGGSFSPQSRGYALGNICSQVVRELKSQYLLGYRSTNTAKDGKWRQIRVKLNPPRGMKLSMRAKTGYYAAGVAD